MQKRNEKMEMPNWACDHLAEVLRFGKLISLGTNVRHIQNTIYTNIERYLERKAETIGVDYELAMERFTRC